MFLPFYFVYFTSSIFIFIYFTCTVLELLTSHFTAAVLVHL